MDKLDQLHLENELRILADHLGGIKKREPMTIGEMESLVSDIIDKLHQLKFR